MAEKNPPYSVMVDAKWSDYNDHLTESYYLYIFSEACDDFYNMIGVNLEYRANGLSYFTVETNIQHKAEVKTGEWVHVTTQICATDDKRIHLVHKMFHTNSSTLLAVCEQVLLHVNLTTRRACSAPDVIMAALARVESEQEFNSPEMLGSFRLGFKSKK